MRRGLRPAVPFLAAALAVLAARAWAQPQPQPSLQVIGFEDVLVLQVDGSLVKLVPGEAAYSVAQGLKTKVVEGAALFLAGGALVSAAPGDSFTLEASGLTVHSGSPEVTAPGRPPVRAPAGTTVPLTGAPEPAPPKPAVPGAPGAEPAASGGPYAPEAAGSGRVPAEPWDPLSALARGMDRLSKLQKPKLELVLELHPFYSFTETYDSNIYMVPPDLADGSVTGGGVVGSWIHEQRAGSAFILPLNRRHKLQAGYELRHLAYSQSPRANDALDQSVGGDYEYTGIRGVKGRVWDRYVNTEDPAFSELVARHRRYSNEAGFRLDIERSRRFTWALTAQDAAHKYLDPSLAALLNRYELSAGAEAGVRVQPKTRVYASYRREVIHYSAGQAYHSKSHRLGLGVDGRLAPRITGQAEADVQLRRYDVPPAAGKRDIATFVSAVNLAYAAGDRTKLSLRLNRDMLESTFSRNRYYVATGASLSASYAYHKLDLGAQAGYEYDRYPEAAPVSGFTGTRLDDLYRFDVRADYHVRPWLLTGLDYTRLMRRSSFPSQFDYTDDRTSATVKLSF